VLSGMGLEGEAANEGQDLDGIIAERGDGFQRHVGSELNSPFVVDPGPQPEFPASREKNREFDGEWRGWCSHSTV
jgi:hypothetical protein